MMMANSLSSKLFDRYQWALRLIGIAHLILITSWFVNDQALITETGIFHSYAQRLINGLDVLAPLLWVLGALALVSARFLFVGLLITLVGGGLTLSQLPFELIKTPDRILIALTALCLVRTSARDQQHQASRWAVAGLFALWAWPSLNIALQHPLNLWGQLAGLNFWGWTSAVPTPLAESFASTSQWIRQATTAALLASLAWGPLACFMQIRLWPLLWCLITPVALWCGEGVPSWSGTALWIIGALSLDMRISRGLDAQLSKRFSLERFSPSSLVKWPLLYIGGWLCLSDHLSVTPLLLAVGYLLWSPPQEDTSTPYYSLVSIVILLCVLGSGLYGWERPKESVTHRLYPLLLTQRDTEWTKLPTARSSLILEYSENGGGSWEHEPHSTLDQVTLADQPWRPLNPLRLAHWFDEITHHQSCQEGPLMDLFEAHLRRHIKRLNTPPLLTPHQLILMRARRVEWVRSGYQFWREEARGFYCIPTNLVVLLKARELVKQAREKLPDMPKLAPDPRRQKRSSSPTKSR